MGEGPSPAQLGRERFKLIKIVNKNRFILTVTYNNSY